METLELVATNPQLSAFARRDSSLQSLADKYRGLKLVNGDHCSKMNVKNARVELREARHSIEATRKELKAPVLAYGKALDGEAKRLTAIVEPVEIALTEQEDSVKPKKVSIEPSPEILVLAEQIAAIRLAVIMKPGYITQRIQAALKTIEKCVGDLREMGGG